MKKVISKFLAFGSIGLLMLSACKKDGALITSNGGKAGELSATSTNLELDKTKLNDTTKIINFSFTAPNFGYNAAVSNSIQIDSAGDNWVKPITVSLTNRIYSQGYSTADFNAMMLKLNLPAGVASKINIRVVHSLSSYVTPTYSNVLTITVYVPGAYEGSTWPNPGPMEDSLVSVTGNGIYVGIINFPSGANQFLVTPKKNWDNKWATSAPATNPSGTSVTYPVVYNGPNNFTAPVAPGYYLITLNTNDNTMSIVPADYYSITGSAVAGWGVDTPMKYINDGNGNWVANNVAMSANEFKFRQDDQWTNSWGPGAAAGTAVSSGATGDGNFVVSTAGNYNFTFNAPATPYGSPILTTTTYTMTKN
jgi:starch-binding outer membrane protein SusE/F